MGFKLQETSGLIKDAGQKTVFKLNHEGAYASQAVSHRTLLIGGRRLEYTYRIDQPFVVWVQRKGIEMPLFAAKVGYADWKDPGSLPHRAV